MTEQELIEAFTDNIKALSTGPITIATKEGPQEVDALLLGDWALNENSAGWAATHRASGYAGQSFPTPIEALISLGVCLGSGLVLPDTVTPDTFSAIPGIREIAARVKAALTILERWELDLDYNEPNVEA